MVFFFPFLLSENCCWVLDWETQIFIGPNRTKHIVLAKADLFYWKRQHAFQTFSLYVPRYLKLNTLLCQFRREPFTKLWLQSQSQSNLESRSGNKVQYGGWTSRVQAGCFLLLASSITCPEINLSEDGGILLLEGTQWSKLSTFSVFFSYLFTFCWSVTDYFQFHCLCPLNLASAQLLLVTDFFWVLVMSLPCFFKLLSRKSGVYDMQFFFWGRARNAARLLPQRVNTKGRGWGSFLTRFR